MTVRITSTTDGQRTVLRIAGRLESADIPVFDHEIRSINGPFVLDLSELISADEAGIESLRGIASIEAELRGVSRFVELLLKNDGGT